MVSRKLTKVRVSISRVGGEAVVAVRHSGDDSHVVGVSSGVGIGHMVTGSHLVGSVSLGISRPLAVVSTVSTIVASPVSSIAIATAVVTISGLGRHHSEEGDGESDLRERELSEQSRDCLLILPEVSCSQQQLQHWTDERGLEQLFIQAGRMLEFTTKRLQQQAVGPTSSSLSLTSSSYT